MKLQSLLPTTQQLELVQGIERSLRQRRRTSAISGLIALVTALLQVVIAVAEEGYLENIGRFFSHLFSGQFDQLLGPEGLSPYELMGLVVVVVSFTVFFLFRRTNFLLRESEEPFRYTFWIAPFTPVEGTPGERFELQHDDQLHLLHHDLMMRLTERIRRLSLLDVEALELPGEAAGLLTSHIHIEGQYVVRELHQDEWVLQVIPRIRVGPPSRPEALANPVNYPLPTAVPIPKPAAADDNTITDTLSAGRYRQIVERVYARVASEIYRQILADVRSKRALFPTDYLRAVALYHEAQDFERSNTVDAYDYAIELYRESRRYFQLRLGGRFWRALARWPLLWRLSARSLRMEALSLIGLSRSLVYRRAIAAFSGQSQNPLFEVQDHLSEAIGILVRLYNRLVDRTDRRLNESSLCRETADFDRTNRYRSLINYLSFPEDAPLRRSRPLFDKLRHTLLDAYAVAALGYIYLGAPEKAECFRDNARAIAPDKSRSHALWLVAAAEIEPDIQQRLLLLRQAVEVAPDFEIAQYLLAYYSEIQLRQQRELKPGLVSSAVDHYDAVLKTNPGNIGALAAQGYLWWSSGQLEQAAIKFEEGLDVKAFVRQTFVGDLFYGLARVAAEEGKFERSAQFYQQAISADPGIGAHAPVSSQAVTPAYDGIGPALLARYEQLRRHVEEEITRQKADIPSEVLGVVHSFVLNDYGNACLNYFHRFGDRTQLQGAIEAFETAVTKNPELVVAYYNLANALGWDRDDHLQRTADMLAQAEKLAPAWSVIQVASMKEQIRQIQDTIKEKRIDKEQAERELEQRRQVESEQRLAPDTEGDGTGLGLSRSDDFLSQSPRSGMPEIKGKAVPEREAAVRARVDMENRLQKLEDDIAGLQDRLSNEIFPKLKQIMIRSKLASLFETVEIDFDGGGVADVLASLQPHQDARYKLDENDVNALRVWAEILANHESSRTALWAAEQLCNLLHVFYPEYFDAARILYQVYRSLETLEQNEEDANVEAIRQASATSRQRLVVIIQHWLAHDPIRYVALNWASAFFERDAYRAALETAVYAWPNNDVYYGLLGEVTYRQEAYPAAINYYHQALKLQPLAEYSNRLGNIYYAQRDYQQAVDCYRQAVDQDKSRAVYFSNLAGAYRELQERAKMADAYREAQQLEPNNADIANDFGNALYWQGDYHEAVKQYKAAIAINPHITVYYDNLASAWEALQEPDEVIAVLQQARKLGIQPNRYGQRIVELERKKQIEAQFGGGYFEMLPVVTPIALEIAADLEQMLNLEAEGTDAIFFTQVEEMRQNIEQTMGVRVPGVRVRMNEYDLGPGTYLIFLEEVPLVMGTISAEKGLFAGSPETLAALGIEGEKTINPVNGETAVWVGHEHWQYLDDAGYAVWSPVDYLINHLAAELRRHLVKFIGHQELMNTLEMAHPTAFAALQGDDLALSALVSLVQRLVREQVPVTALVEITDLFRQRWQPETSVLSLLNDVRRLPQIRPALPGNSLSFQFYRLGPDLEGVLQDAVRTVDGQSYLALEPEQTQAVLAGVRSAVAENGRSSAILVTQPDIRPFVRKLVELEFPNLPVLAMAELQEELAQNIVAEIEVATQSEAGAVAV